MATTADVLPFSYGDWLRVSLATSHADADRFRKAFIPRQVPKTPADWAEWDKEISACVALFRDKWQKGELSREDWTWIIDKAEATIGIISDVFKGDCQASTPSEWLLSARRIDNVVQFPDNPFKHNDAAWNWAVDYNVHSLDPVYGKVPTCEEIAQLARDVDKFPYWPADALRRLHDSLAPYDYPNGYYILTNFDFAIYYICLCLFKPLADTIKETPSKNFDPMSLDGSYRFDSEVFEQGVGVFRHRLRRIARPLFWNTLPLSVQTELIDKCRKMIEQVERAPPKHYGLVARLKELFSRVNCVLV